MARSRLLSQVQKLNAVRHKHPEVFGGCFIGTTELAQGREFQVSVVAVKAKALYGFGFILSVGLFIRIRKQMEHSTMNQSSLVVTLVTLLTLHVVVC